jgi:glutathione S-transferase
MIVLYGFGPAFNLPDPSPFVMKSEVQLKMAGVPYRREHSVPAAGPKGKIPFIQAGELRIGDSTFIRAYIEKEYAIDLDSGLILEERAQAWAIERMLEDHLYFAEVQMRWMRDENFAKGPAHFFDGAPQGARAAARERVRANLLGQGFGRHGEAEIVALGARSLSALSALLGDKPCLFGDVPCGTDATAFAMVAAILTDFFDSPLRDSAMRHANLVAYRDRMMARYYPEFALQAA